MADSQTLSAKTYLSRTLESGIAPIFRIHRLLLVINSSHWSVTVIVGGCVAPLTGCHCGV